MILCLQHPRKLNQSSHVTISFFHHDLPPTIHSTCHQCLALPQVFLFLFFTLQAHYLTLLSQRMLRRRSWISLHQSTWSLFVLKLYSFRLECVHKRKSPGDYCSHIPDPAPGPEYHAGSEGREKAKCSPQHTRGLYVLKGCTQSSSSPQIVFYYKDSVLLAGLEYR